MGKTKTAFVTETDKPEKSGKEAYEEKMKKKAEKEAAAKAAEAKSEEKPAVQTTSEPDNKTKDQKPKDKDQIKGVGLRGGERIKVVGAELPEETPTTETAEPQTETKREKKPKIRSKKYNEAKKKVNSDKLYKLDEAVKLLTEIKFSNFDETVELHFVLKQKAQPVNVTLPHSGGKQKKIEVANDETIEKLKAGKVDFDVLLATAEMMPKLVPFARLLGPKGLMPNPKTGTLIKSEKEAEKFSGNTLTLKTEKEQPVVHTAIGKLSQKDTEIVENAEAVFGAFPKQIVKAYIKSTMSPSVKLQL